MTTQHASDAPQFDHDVFVSYSHADEAWVVGTLLGRLEGAGLKVCIDFRDFRPGRASILNMTDAVARSRRTLLVMTPSWVSREWTAYEGILSRTGDPAGFRERTIPLLREACDVPPYVAFLTYVDFTREDRVGLAWRQLLTALGARPEPPVPEQPSRAQWHLVHPYPMPPNFTGRVAERDMLSRWLTEDVEQPLLVLRALGGFGKSALTWHWLLHDVHPARWPRVVWWSFYEPNATFESFLTDALGYLTRGKFDPSAEPSRHEVDALIEELRAPGTLLVFDGFERELRAFVGLDAAYLGDDAGQAEDSERDCVSTLADAFLRGLVSLPGLRGRVLITTRLRPSAVEARGRLLLRGCREKELAQLGPGDAVEFFHAQGVRGTRTEIEEACEPYGYHPLSLRLLAGLIVNDLRLPGDVATAQRLDVSGDLVQRQHHVLSQAYDALRSDRRGLLDGIACFRGAVSYEAITALHAGTAATSATNAASLDAGLLDLVARGLVQRDLRGNLFELHPIVRRYVYARLTPAERSIIHARLRDHFAANSVPAAVQTLGDLAPLIELYHHTVGAGQFEQALKLFADRLREPIHFQFNAHRLRIELLRALFPDGDDRPPRVTTEVTQAMLRVLLANSYVRVGQPRRALALAATAIVTFERQKYAPALPTTLNTLAASQLEVGALGAAEDGFRRQLAICRERVDVHGEAIACQDLGWLLACRGAWAESEAVHLRGIDLARSGAARQIECVIRAYTARRALLMNDPARAAAEATLARELANVPVPGLGQLPIDVLRADWVLGAAQLALGALETAERRLSATLERNRRIGLVEYEAGILVDLARLRAIGGAHDAAQRLADEALLITERSGYVLQGADTHLVLAELAQARGDVPAAREHAAEALRLATCDGPPDYTYKAAYDEATALLARLDEGT
jgi:tetratricopeptide (TPR) repeat protein